MDIDKNIEEILEQIREARKKKGMSQAEVATHLGINQNSYKNIETGQTELKVRVLFQLIELLEIDLFTNSEKEKVSYPIDEDTIREMKNDLQEIKSKMSKVDQIEEFFKRLEEGSKGKELGENNEVN